MNIWSCVLSDNDIDNFSISVFKVDETLNSNQIRDVNDASLNFHWFTIFHFRNIFIKISQKVKYDHIWLCIIWGPEEEKFFIPESKVDETLNSNQIQDINDASVNFHRFTIVHINIMFINISQIIPYILYFLPFKQVFFADIGKIFLMRFSPSFDERINSNEQHSKW